METLDLLTSTWMTFRCTARKNQKYCHTDAFPKQHKASFKNEPEATVQKSIVGVGWQTSTIAGVEAPGVGALHWQHLRAIGCHVHEPGMRLLKSLKSQNTFSPNEGTSIC